MGKYYDEIMADKQTSFLQVFNQKWKEEMISHKMKYHQAAQIVEGNRLRPIIMAWGYYSNASNFMHKYIADFAVCIELIHKASILLDDLIDEDSARHGRKTFHIEYSKTEAILYAIFLLNRSVTIMHEKDIKTNSVHLSTMLKVIDNMVRGGIKEVNSENFFSLQDSIEIINLETISLIENSFFLGYQLSNENIINSDISFDIYNIGHLCGYCFQILNDLEPFSAPAINKSYKGAVNYDFEKNRKNIIISYLYGACTKKERQQLENFIDFKQINNLIYKYKIMDLILDDVNIKITSIKKSITVLEKTNPLYCIDFKKFLDYMFKICFQKCGLTFENKFFN